MLVGRENKQTKKQNKKDHRSLPAVLAAGGPGQRREVLARHWEDGQPVTDGKQMKNKILCGLPCFTHSRLGDRDDRVEDFSDRLDEFLIDP